VKTVQLLRTAIGLAVIAAVTFRYRLASSVPEALGGRFSDSWSSAIALTGTFPVVIGLFIAFSADRGAMLRGALRSLGSILALWAGMFTFALAQAPEFAGIRALPGTLAPVVNLIVGAFLLLWMLPFVLYGIYLSLVHVFRTADIHAFLPPVLASILTWEMAAQGWYTGAYEGAPTPVRMAVLLGGPVSVTLISVWECSRL
jgi:hypothetical protein